MRVNRKAEGRAASGHPWIFASDIEDRGGAQPGDTVKVVGPRGQAIGIAHFSSTSQITLRVLGRRLETTDSAFFQARIGEALAHRKRVVTDSEAFRLVYSEGDRLPGLIADYYNGHVVLQLLTQGMDRSADTIVAVLQNLLNPRSIVARNDVPVRKLESLPLESRVLFGAPPDRVEFRMNGLVLQADLVRGQKTGTFLDQRENYLAAARFARGNALDCFSSTGGFALHLAKSCERVEAVDSSAEALRIAGAAAEANGISNIQFREANVFDLLSGYAGARRRFGAVVLDPPAFAKSRANRDAALKAYREINYKALRLIETTGILVTCSCSHHVSESDLLETVAAAALDAGRTLRVLERRSQGQDHPILLTVPETLYLKCLILQCLD